MSDDIDLEEYPVGKPKWDETPVTLNVVQTILEAHPDYTLTSHYGPDGNRYMMIQFFDEEPNHQANSDFVSFVSELDSRDGTGSGSDGGNDE